MWTLAQIVFGGVLLLAGRRLFWLLAAGAGFVVGLILAQSLLREQPETVALLVALVVAIAFALLAVLGQKFIIGLVGFVAGGIGLVRLLQTLGQTPAETTTLLTIVVFLAGGVVGAILLSKLFDLGLIILSSVIGADILVGGLSQATDLAAGWETILLVGFVVLGIFVQLGLFRRL